MDAMYGNPPEIIGIRCREGQEDPSSIQWEDYEKWSKIVDRDGRRCLWKIARSFGEHREVGLDGANLETMA